MQTGNKFLTMLFAAVAVFWTGAALANVEAYNNAVEDVRGYLAGMNPEMARASLKDAVKHATDRYQKTEIARLDECINLIEDYLSVMSNFCANNTLDEIKLSETEFVKIVEMNKDRITVRSQGVNKTYMINQLSPKFVRILVGKSYNANKDIQAVFGAFEAFHPKGDRSLARKLWSASSLDKQMLEELDVPRVPPIIQRGPDKRLPIPTDDEVEKGMEFVNTKFGKFIENADTPQAKIKLSNQLIQMAAKNKALTPGQKMACFKVAEQQVKDILQISPRYDVLEQKEKVFKTRTFRQRYDLVVNANADPSDPDACRDIAAAAGKILFDCGETNRFDEAKQIIPLAKTAAQVSGNSKLFKYADQAEKYLEAQEKKNAASD
ncbi:MAG: hypothetical protein IJF84_14365 [Thermoguttaceae bacterium]|nr:hypothetical protein [Thermoguttaceae bacterium]